MFAVSCSHTNAMSTVTVAHSSCRPKQDDSSVRDLTQKMEIVCESCFQNHAMNWARVEVSRSILNSELCCDECDASPARWFDDVDGGVCDNCRMGLYEQERGFCSSYKCFTDYEVQIPDEIIPGLLYLGSINSACHELTLESCRIRHILICSSFLPAFHEDTKSSTQYVYHRLPLCDSTDEDLVRYLPQACQFIDNCVAQNEPVLVHCAAGVSRSASVCIAYIMKVKDMSYDQAFEYIRQRRNCISPNSKFVEDLSNSWAAILEAQS